MLVNGFFRHSKLGFLDGNRVADNASAHHVGTSGDCGKGGADHAACKAFSGSDGKTLLARLGKHGCGQAFKLAVSNLDAFVFLGFVGGLRDPAVALLCNLLAFGFATRGLCFLALAGPKADKIASFRDVVKHGHDGKRKRHEHDGPAEHPHHVAERIEKRAHHVAVLHGEHDDGDHLEHRFELAVPAGRNDNAFACRYHAHARYDELAGHDDERHPAWQHA